MIPFNKPYCSGRELSYIQEVCQSMTMSGNGEFTKLCHGFMEKRYGFIYVDKDNDGNGDLHREKKDSFDWYKKVIASNGADLD